MGPIWGRQDPGGPHVGPMNIAIWDINGNNWCKNDDDDDDDDDNHYDDYDDDSGDDKGKYWWYSYDYGGTITW